MEGDGHIVTENIAVLAWMGHRWPESGQLPLDDLPALARVFELLSWFATIVHHGGFGPIFRARAAEIDSLLAPGPWLLGDRYSLADPYPLTFRRWASRLGLDVEPHHHWTTHTARITRRPAVLRALAREGVDPKEF